MATEPHLWKKGYEILWPQYESPWFGILAKTEVIYKSQVLAWKVQVRSMPNISEESAHTKRLVSYRQMEREFGNLTIHYEGSEWQMVLSIMFTKVTNPRDPICVAQIRICYGGSPFRPDGCGGDCIGDMAGEPNRRNVLVLVNVGYIHHRWYRIKLSTHIRQYINDYQCTLYRRPVLEILWFGVLFRAPRAWKQQEYAAIACYTQLL